MASSCSSPASPSISSANRRFVMTRPSMLTVPWCSRKMLNKVGERNLPWRTPTDVWNQSPTVPCTIIALLAFAYSCLMVLINFWSMLYLFIMAHNGSCYTLSNPFLLLFLLKFTSASVHCFCIQSSFATLIPYLI